MTEEVNYQGKPVTEMTSDEMHAAGFEMVRAVILQTRGRMASATPDDLKLQAMMEEWDLAGVAVGLTYRLTALIEMFSDGEAVKLQMKALIADLKKSSESHPVRRYALTTPHPDMWDWVEVYELYGLAGALAALYLDAPEDVSPANLAFLTRRDVMNSRMGSMPLQVLRSLLTLWQRALLESRPEYPQFIGQVHDIYQDAQSHAYDLLYDVQASTDVHVKLFGDNMDSGMSDFADLFIKALFGYWPFDYAARAIEVLNTELALAGLDEAT